MSAAVEPREPAAGPAAARAAVTSAVRVASRRLRRHLPAGAATTRAVHLAAAAGILAVLVWQLGTGPFLDGLRAVDAQALAAATALAALTTVCAAWRWKAVAGGLGVELPLGTAVAAYYRSIFLNLTLPGGVVGDVHRGVRLGLRAVVWERTAGQVVQIFLTVAVLLVLPSPVRGEMPLVAAGLLVAAVAVALAIRRRPPLRALRAWPVIALTSALVAAGHAATFVIAARTAGATAPASELLPLALLVLLIAALPNLGGWGPREGAAAWAFAAAGLGASLGVTTGVVYGVMVLFAGLPGAAVLLLGVRRA